MISKFNGTSTPKGSHHAKTGDNVSNVNSSHYSLRTALCERICYQAKSEQNVRQDLIHRVRHGEAALHPRKPQGVLPYSAYSVMASLTLRKPCTVIQVYQVDGKESWTSQEKVGMIFKVERKAMELSVVEIRGYFDLPQYANVYREVYNYQFNKYLINTYPVQRSACIRVRKWLYQRRYTSGSMQRTEGASRLNKLLQKNTGVLAFDLSWFLISICRPSVGGA